MRPLRYRVHIKATPEQVWRGITDGDFTSRYFFGTAFTSALEPGSAVRYVRDGSDLVAGEILVSEPPRRLVTSWRVLYDASAAAEPPSQVEWLITDDGDGLTRLDVVHTDLARSPHTWAGVKDGWHYVLDGLKSVLETGSGLPPYHPDPAPEDVAGDWHRIQGIDANNAGWSLVESFSPGDDEEPMLRAAYAAAFHWSRATGATPLNEARALLLIGRAHLAGGRPDVADHYALRCQSALAEAGREDFDLAYALDLRARAQAALGDADLAASLRAQARAVPIATAEDREILLADLAVPLTPA